MIVPTYPNDFFDFNNGKNISDIEINKWIQECIDNLEKNKQSSSNSVSSGNTLVTVYRVNDSYFKYKACVSKGYYEAEITK